MLEISSRFCRGFLDGPANLRAPARRAGDQEAVRLTRGLRGILHFRRWIRGGRFGRGDAGPRVGVG